MRRGQAAGGTFRMNRTPPTGPLQLGRRCADVPRTVAWCVDPGVQSAQAHTHSQSPNTVPRPRRVVASCAAPAALEGWYQACRLRAEAPCQSGGESFGCTPCPREPKNRSVQSESPCTLRLDANSTHVKHALGRHCGLRDLHRPPCGYSARTDLRGVSTTRGTAGAPGAKR